MYESWCLALKSVAGLLPDGTSSPLSELRMIRDVVLLGAAWLADDPGWRRAENGSRYIVPDLF